ncbi:hypothetical protein VE23_12245 [Paenibacillus sp. D9]|uniref:sensor histidine kinase n=1 Tax=Paenibacillus sp. D9 TaxID=665792 RepID=UPI00061F897D|nr:sensor histidine kinase [Paenibacillus sp. D9]KKC47700.1 hypothetical protein VE23_12245 [Paenibacillus sp. D9]
MAKLTEIYHIYFRSKLFNGIILVFSLVTIVTFCSLGALVYSYSRDSVLGKERGLQAETAGSVSRYLDQRLDQAQDIMLTLYQNQPVLSDLLYCLRYDFPSYIQNRLNQYIASGGSEDRNIETYVRAQMKKKDDIRQIALYSRSQRFFFVFNSSNTQGISWISRDGDDVQRAIDAMRGSRTASSRTAGLNSILGLGSGDYTFTFDINDPDTLQNEGALLVTYSAEGIRNLLRSDPGTAMGSQLVLYPNGQVLFDSSGKWHGSYPHMQPLLASQGYAKLDRASYTSALWTPRSNLFVGAIVPAAEMERQYKGLKLKLFTLTALGILIMIGLAYGAVYRHARRTRILIRAMKQAKQGNLSIRVPVGSQDELGEISSTFNGMLEELRAYIDQVYVSDARQKQAELMALQAQINPHFLYNTLEAIRMRAMIQGADDVGEMTFVLASLFRYSVRPETIVRLEDEMAYCRQYLELHRIRHRDKLHYSIKIEDSLREAPLLKLCLQPLAENAVVHGFNPKSPDNRIDISARKEEANGEFCLIIEVEDNGKGMEIDRLLAIQKQLAGRSHGGAVDSSPADGASIAPPPAVSGPAAGSSIGLRNVNERIRLQFGDGYGLSLASQKGKGTRITLRLPLYAKEEDHVQRLDRR